MFDAADETVDCGIEVIESAPGRAAVIGPGHATGLPARLQSGPVNGAGVLDADGRVTLALLDEQQQSVTESVAWNHDWSTTVVTIGADEQEFTPNPRADPTLCADPTAVSRAGRLPG